MCVCVYIYIYIYIYVRLIETPWTAACQASLSFTVSQSLLKLMSIELVMLSNHLILCCPLLLLPSVFPSIRVFSQWIDSSHQVAEVLELQLQHQSFQRLIGLISLRIDWFDLLAVQGTLKSLLQHYSSKGSVLHIRWPNCWSFNFSISPSNEYQGWFPLGLTGLISLLSKGLSRVFSSTTVWKHQFFDIWHSLWSKSHICTCALIIGVC